MENYQERRGISGIEKGKTGKHGEKRERERERERERNFTRWSLGQTEGTVSGLLWSSSSCNPRNFKALLPESTAVTAMT